jgi:FkbM family methyltransferase
MQDHNQFLGWQLQTPVVFLIFRRPETTAQVFAEIARARPPKLLVVADGPRADRPGEAEKCAAARAIIEQVDWPCEVLTNYADSNMGCARRVSSGLDWAFSLVEEAIILEDDCLPHPTFFRYCEELLERYRDDERIMVVSGDNFQQGRWRTEDSYYFSRYPHCWGWASWRRAWQHYDHEMRLWPTVRDNGWLHDILQYEPAVAYWAGIFQKTYEGGVDSWAYRWTLNCWLQSGLTALPKVNLVSNIGCGQDETHTRGSHPNALLPAQALRFPLQHPQVVVRSKRADEFTDYHHFYISQSKSSYKRVRSNIDKALSVSKKLWLTGLKGKRPFLAQTRLQLRKLKRQITGKHVSPEQAEYERLYAELNHVPRYTERQIKVNKWSVNIPDKTSFLWAFREIFISRIYAFPFDGASPYILDLGANIGLSVLFFKQIYPNARIVAFEADPQIYRYLEQNVHGNGYTDVILINKAVWDSTTTLEFHPEGADAGRVVAEGNQDTIEVAAIDVQDILREHPADFFKIDIEGAEEIVLPASRDYLPHIPFIFVEYHSRPEQKQSLHKIVNLLTEYGFRIHIHSVMSRSLPFMQSFDHADFDLQLNIFAYKSDLSFVKNGNS